MVHCHTWPSHMCLLFSCTACRLQHENRSLQVLLTYTKEHSEVGADEGTMSCGSISMLLAGEEGGEEAHSSQAHSVLGSARRGCLRDCFDTVAAAGGAVSIDEEVAAVDSYYTSLLASASKREPPPAELELGLGLDLEGGRGSVQEGGHTQGSQDAPSPPVHSMTEDGSRSVVCDGAVAQQGGPAAAGAECDGAAAAVEVAAGGAVAGGAQEQDGWSSGDAMSPATVRQQRPRSVCGVEQQHEEEATPVEGATAPAPESAPVPEPVLDTAPAVPAPPSAARGKKGKKGKGAAAAAAAVGGKGGKGGLSAAGAAPSSPPDVAGAFDADAHVILHTATAAPASPAADARAVQDVGCV